MYATLKNKCAGIKNIFNTEDKKRTLRKIAVAAGIAVVDTVIFKKVAKSSGYSANIFMFAPNAVRATKDVITDTNRNKGVDYLMYVVARQYILMTISKMVNKNF